jgi:DNA-binding NtrC family response regulator
MRDLQQEIACAARADAKVLITGESGVGKEVAAKLLHQQSARGASPLVTINCAGVPDSLLESELFGHVRGSFTDAYRDKAGYLEQAHNGTIFMDEVGEMSLRMQALLLRFLENGEIQRVGSERIHGRVDVRVISATNRSLFDQMSKKEFREDLYYRLNVIHLEIPPLRARREDIRPLFEHFVRYYSHRHHVDMPRILEEAMARLIAYDWPGNVRELKNAAERVVIRAQSGLVAAADLPVSITGARYEEAATSPLSSTAVTVGDRMPSRSMPDVLLEQLRAGASFWSAVYMPFMARDLTRADLRTLVERGLEETRGNYKALLTTFNLPRAEYKRFLGFLTKHGCHVPFQRYRSPGSIPRSGARAMERPGRSPERFESYAPSGSETEAFSYQ